MNSEDQKKFDELNQKWLEAIRDWKGIIAEKDREIKTLKEQILWYKNTYQGTIKNALYIIQERKKQMKELETEIEIYKTLIDGIKSVVEE